MDGRPLRSTAHSDPNCLWWSAFTALTGAVAGFHALLLTRFCFGAGEAGAFSSAAANIASWFPASERGRAFGFFLYPALLVGGALSPFLVIPIQMRYGWRASFTCSPCWEWFGELRGFYGSETGLAKSGALPLQS